MHSLLTPAQQQVFSWIEDYISQHRIAPTHRDIQKGLQYRSPASIQSHIEALSNKGFISYPSYVTLDEVKLSLNAESLVQRVVGHMHLIGECFVISEINCICRDFDWVKVLPFLTEFIFSKVIQEGYIPRKPRSIKILKSSREIPVLGSIAAHSLVEVFPDTEIEYLDLSFLPKFARLSQYELAQHFALRVRGDSMVGALIADGDIVVLRRESDPRAIRNGAIVAARVNGATTLKHYYRNGRQITLQPANPHYEPTVLNANSAEIEVQGVYINVALRGGF